MQTYKRFLILANERTGSTATARLLGGHPEIEMSHLDGRIFTNSFSWDGLLEEGFINIGYFQKEDLYHTLNQAVLLKFIDFSARNKKKVLVKNPKQLGMKCTFYNQSEDCLHNMVETLKKSDEKVSIVHLTRDYLESFVSIQILYKTKRSKDVTEEEKQETLNTKVSLKDDKYDRYVSRLRKRNDLMASLKDHTSYLQVDYSELMDDLNQTATKIADFLAVSTEKEAINSCLSSWQQTPKRLTMPPEHYIAEE